MTIDYGNDVANRGAFTERQGIRRDRRLAAGKAYHGGWAGQGQGYGMNDYVPPGMGGGKGSLPMPPPPTGNPTFGGGGVAEGAMPGVGPANTSRLFSSLVSGPGAIGGATPPSLMPPVNPVTGIASMNLEGPKVPIPAPPVNNANSFQRGMAPPKRGLGGLGMY